MPLRILHPPKPARAFHGFIAKRPAKTLASQCIRLVSPEDHLSANTHTTQMKVRTKSLTINIKLIALQVGFAINKCRLLIFFFEFIVFKNYFMNTFRLSSILGQDQARVLPGLILVQNVCKGYQQMKLAYKELNAFVASKNAGADPGCYKGGSYV